MNKQRWMKAASVLLVCVTSQVTNADKTYIYKEADGTVWYTNVAPASQDNRRFQLIAVKGRPTATSSCRGMSPKKLDHRAVSYNSSIQRFSNEFKVDSKLVKAIVRNESCFDKMAVSSAGAQGLMQLMPPTAKSLGVHDAFDAEQNLRGGIRYLSELITRYDNNLALALAAYNAGPGTVEKFAGVPPYKETQHYVERVMKSYREYLKEYLQADAG